jgi:tRNA-splicing ligase RtcB (3'-phosphate/5'-hydroxy nucleic acid ligase)
MGSSKIRWFASQVEDEAREQVERTASMPFVKGVAVMPDCHFGKGSTVGTVVATKGAIMPACVGVDIGCGMIAVRTTLTPESVRPHLKAIREGIERRIPVGVGGRGENSRVTGGASLRIGELMRLSVDLFGSALHMDQRAGSWQKQLGSLGGGNHFIEVCIGHPIEEGFVGPHDDAQAEVWVILHSGSRGVGNKTGTHWTRVAKEQAKRFMYADWLPDGDLAYLIQGTPEFEQYMKELQWCQEYAHLNREEMMDRVITELWHTVQGGRDDGQIEIERINCHHNYVSRENHDGDNVLITRKGAILAAEGVRGLIPGSMGARSFITTGLGNPGAYRSAPHGAGRRMSRTAARKQFTVEGVTAEMEAQGIESRIREAIVDEAPGAYKDIDVVMADAAPLVRPTHVLRQIVSVKGD